MATYLNELGSRLDASVVADCREAYINTSVLSCGNNKPVVEHSMVTALLMIKKIKSGVQSHLRTRKTKKEVQILNQVNKVVSCMEGKLAEEMYIECGPCSNDPSRAAQTRITVLTKSIELCPQFTKFTREFDRAHILVHEISHLCGTVDTRYMGISDESHDHGLSISHMRNPVTYKTTRTYTFAGFNVYSSDSYDAHQNADNYAYWARFGFCIPGECGRKK